MNCQLKLMNSKKFCNFLMVFGTSQLKIFLILFNFMVILYIPIQYFENLISSLWKKYFFGLIFKSCFCNYCKIYWTYLTCFISNFE